MSGKGLGSIHSGAEIAALSSTLPPRESFGPESDRPCLVLRLADADPGLASWLTTLPCPVIGIGHGPLAESCDIQLDDESALPLLVANIAETPLAAMVLVQLLRTSGTLPEAEALIAESFAYATIQAGPEFRRWQSRRSIASATMLEPGPPVMMERDGGHLTLTMNRPASLNAIGIEMRDALVEAFDMASIDPDISTILLKGRGRCFCIGGDIREFGQASDPATAHWIRTLRLPAASLPRLRDRLTARVQGAAIGGGVEIAAFARRIVATPDAWFQLPELKYGLIPGAGGTVSLPRRIGRQRTAYMALSMRRISAQVALAWGLIDAIEPMAPARARANTGRKAN
ncbi:enoyl-CoA hydratase/isomerase family protein [Flavisphingomonas formosensis]|uniref:enoyl-CoA hydratase/isomerase family protein n=1 Tax=Flavisphingomonas formosensis TaxID=861534 RepID=UPI0012FC46AC|nr:enoyl-CoA hydratase/isomerase family protein [Sphingomonas formosensis]